MEMNISELIDVLTQGTSHAMALESHLNQPFFSPESCKLSLRQLQSALATAMGMTKIMEQGRLLPPLPQESDSPTSDCSGRTFKEQERRERCKKRKALPRWSRQMRACLGSAMEGPIDDGHSWRKYGQKDILGTKFPRGYYRCTYRNTHGCDATKQVQRSDEDPSIFHITYRGDHTCNHGLQNDSLLSPKAEQLQEQQLLEIFRTGLRVKTEGLGSDERKLEPSPSFSFPPMPASCINPDNNNNVLCSASMPENHMGCDSEITAFSATTSTTSSPMAGMDFEWEQLLFDSLIPFEFC
ncbi:putative WRKY transcription factor 41 [Platanthera guangdongensis]|uniref:WRKY transcription factor 41 n=1 Tax=Platanthera guangdongensis TaxID=2320717 RepID=A0ABR2N1N5_9ASPA